MALCGESHDDVYAVRGELMTMGEPGNPSVMARHLKDRLGSEYNFEISASLSDMINWLNAGEFLITHGWFTGSGHVIALRSVMPDMDTFGVKFEAWDPWSEFDFAEWRYPSEASEGFRGSYSALGIYAAAVVGESVDARSVYRYGETHLDRKGAWVHRIRAEAPKK